MNPFDQLVDKINGQVDLLLIKAVLATYAQALAYPLAIGAVAWFLLPHIIARTLFFLRSTDK